MPYKKTRPLDVITIGAAVRDIFLWLAPTDVEIMNNPRPEPTRRRLLALEYGAKIGAAKSAFSLGGGALNSAVSFSRMGLKTAALVALGCDDNADAVIADMKREKIGTGLVSYHSRRPTGFSVLLVAGQEREHAAIVERGANELLSFPSIKKLGGAKWYYTAAIYGSDWIKTVSDIAAQAADKKVLWAWNPGGEQLARGVGALGRWLKHCAVFTVNRDEALELVGSENKPRQRDIKYLLSAFLLWGPKMVIITDGADGAYCAHGEQIFYVAADAKVKVVESTGAGDAFGSGFVSGLIMTKNQNIPYALALAMANAESVLGHIGAQEGILRKRDIDKAVAKTMRRIKKLK